MISRLNIRLGELNLYTNPDCEGLSENQKCSDPHVTVEAEEIVVHHTYDDRADYSDDIALVRMNQTIKFSREFYLVFHSYPNRDFLFRYILDVFSFKYRLWRTTWQYGKTEYIIIYGGLRA